MKKLTKPINGKLTSKFGERVHPVTKVKGFHNGIDIAAPVGTPVLAPADGKITELFDSEKGGLCMALETPDGTRFGFAHLSKRYAAWNEPVAQGQHIAASGNTGRTTGPHLHFTVKQNGDWIDPLTMFKY
ncbi:MAG: M23 family metallopeptidase [Bacteroidales bacterium]|nr:M23 family metallopeptidase [Bacteroidales bacterium]